MDIKILFLGVVQGLTEFLPVSSSGHLAFFQLLFDYTEPNMLSYDIILHIATLFATLCFFRADIICIARECFLGFFSKEARASDGWRYGWSVIVGTVVTVIIAFPLKKIVEFAITSPLFVACGLFFTAVILWLMQSISSSSNKVSMSKGILIGAAQGLAVLPGVSRSGLTIFSGMMSGLAPEAAFKFSFILSIPAIIGATLLEAVDMYKLGNFSMPDGWIWGGVLAFAFGLLSLMLLRRFVLQKHWRGFSIYCFFVAGLVLLFNFLR